MVRRALLLAGLVLLGLLAAAPVAGAQIVVGKGIAGVRLSMTETKVRQVLGTPDQVKHASNAFGPYTEYVYRGRRLRVTFFGGNRVTSVATTKASERTTSGVGVGSTKAQVIAGVPHVVCQGNICQVGKSLPGRRVTAFFLHSGKVTRVLVGFVID